jgi:hypothetical protein
MSIRPDIDGVSSALWTCAWQTVAAGLQWSSYRVRKKRGHHDVARSVDIILPNLLPNSLQNLEPRCNEPSADWTHCQQRHLPDPRLSMVEIEVPWRHRSSKSARMTIPPLLEVANQKPSWQRVPPCCLAADSLSTLGGGQMGDIHALHRGSGGRDTPARGCNPEATGPRQRGRHS